MMENEFRIIYDFIKEYWVIHYKGIPDFIFRISKGFIFLKDHKRLSPTERLYRDFANMCIEMLPNVPPPANVSDVTIVLSQLLNSEGKPLEDVLSDLRGDNYQAWRRLRYTCGVKVDERLKDGADHARYFIASCL